MLDKRRVELLLDLVTLDRREGETLDEASARWWREHGDEFGGYALDGRPIVNVCRSL